VTVLGRRVGGFVTTIDVALATLVGGITISSTVGVDVCVFVGVVVSVTVWVTRGVAFASTFADEFANWALIKMINVTINPRPSGRMMLSGSVSGRSPGRFGNPLRASSMLRRRGCVAPSLVTTGFTVDCCVAKELSDCVTSIAFVAFGDELRGFAKPDTSMAACVLLGTALNAASIASLSSRPV
jgi:hypothetical protein